MNEDRDYASEVFKTTTLIDTVLVGIDYDVAINALIASLVTKGALSIMPFDLFTSTVAGHMKKLFLSMEANRNSH